MPAVKPMCGDQAPVESTGMAYACQLASGLFLKASGNGQYPTHQGPKKMPALPLTQLDQRALMGRRGS